MADGQRIPTPCAANRQGNTSHREIFRNAQPSTNAATAWPPRYRAPSRGRMRSGCAAPCAPSNWQLIVQTFASICLNSRLLWFISVICAYQRPVLRIQYHFAELLAFFQSLMRRRSFAQRKAFVDNRLNLAGEDMLHHLMKVAHGSHKRSQERKLARK